MVRWTQLNALMPALQFSIAPWDLSEETAMLCAQAVALRKKVCTTASADIPSYDHAEHRPHKCKPCFKFQNAHL